MKKIFTLFLGIYGLGLLSLNAQALNQAANWPNTSWTLSGSYSTIGLLNNPTLTANFSFDDDVAGSGSSDILFVESPVIDLTAANAAGETLLNVIFDYDYNLGDVFQLEYFDADATAWVLWEILPDNSTATSNWCGNIAAPEVTSVDLNTLFFTATQQSGFKYRFHYEGVLTWGWGVCVSSPFIVSSAPPTCPIPTALNASANSATSASLSWIENGTATSWQIENQTTGVLSVASTNPAAISGLAANTPYQVRVRAICGVGDTSIWSAQTGFTTPCVAYTAPYIESFNTAPIDACASQSASVGGPWVLGAPGISWNTACGLAPADHTNNGGFYISNDMSGTDAGVVYQLPDVDVAGLTTPLLNFYHYMCGAPQSQNELFVEAWDGSAWSLVSLVNTGTGAWESYGFDLTGFTFGTIARIRFRIEPSTLGSVFDADIAIDDITIDEAPSCFTPTALTSANITDISADLSWTENSGATLWEVQYGTAGFTLGTGTSVYPVGSPNAFLSGLISETNYEVYVRAICAPGDTSSWSIAPSSFTTDIDALICGPGGGNPSIVYTEDFETDVTIGPGGSGGNVGPWTQVRTADPDWTWDGIGGTGSSNTGPSSAHTGVGFVYLETSGSAQDADTLTSGLYDLSLVNTPARLRFWYHMFGADMGTMTVETSGDGGVTWNAGIDFVGQQQASSAEAWKEAVVDISYAVGANNFQVRFIGDKNGTGFTGDMAIDFIQIEACVSCVAPSAPTATVISFDSAQIDFTSFGSADSTFIEYGVAGFALGTGTVVSTLNDSVILAGLSGATSYDVYLLSDCSGSTGDSSVAAGPVSFLTPCSPFTPVYFEDFSSWTGTTTLPICWEEYDQVTPATFASASPSTTGQWLQDGFGNDASSPYSVSAFVGSASINLWNLSDQDWLVSPSIDLTNGGPYQLDYNWTLTDFSQTFFEQITGDDYLAVLITSDDGLTWTELERYDSSTVIAVTPLGETAVFDLTSFSGSVVRIGFFGDEGTVDDVSDVKFFMDNFRVRPIPTCPEPIALAASNPTDVTVDLSWTETGSATEWEVEYGAPGFTPGTGTSLIVVGASNTTVTGLTEQTAYEFIVRAICAPGDSSSYSLAVGATTLCSPIVAAVLEDFETVPFATFGDLGNCWSTSPTSGYRWESENSSGFNENSSGTGPFTDHTLTPAAGGIYMYTEASSGIAGDSTFLNSPLVDLTPLAFPNVTFWYHMFGATMGELHLQINDGTGWTTIASVIGQQQTAGGDEWRKLSTNITAYTGIVSFRFIGVRGTSFTSDISVDDISIQEAPTNDIGVASIDAPVSGCGTNSSPLTITVDNLGVNDLFYTPVVVEITGDIAGIYTLVIDTILGESSASVTLGSLNTSSGGSVDVTAFTNLANDIDRLNDTIEASFTFGAVPAAPAIADLTVCDGDSAVLGFNSLGALSWFETDTSSSAFFVGDTYTLAGVDTTFYVSQQATSSGMATLDLFDSSGDGWNGHTLAVSINGAPVVGSPFTIGTGNSAQVMFPLNNGDLLSLEMFTGSFANQISYTLTGPNGATIFEDGFASQISLGVVFDEEVALLGCPSDLTMVSVMVSPTYLDTVVMSTCDSMIIAGATVTTSGFYTDSLSSSSGCDSVVVYNLTVNSSYLASESVTICAGSSYTLPDGSVVTTGGSYTSVLLASNACDSVIKTEVLISPVYDVSQNVQLCSGDTLTVGASQYTASGTYVDTLSTANGCDSLVTSNVVVFSSSDVSIAGVTVVCSVAPAVDLTLNPLGGTLSGPGVTGTSFDPAAAGVGTSTLVYSFADGNGCDASASLDVEVVVCTGIEDIEGIETVSIFPNPFVSTINVLFEDAVAAELNIKLFDITGKVILVKNVNTSLGLNKIVLDVSSEIAAGVAMLQIERNGAVFSTTLLKK